MYVRRFNRAKIAAGQTIKVGGIRIYLSNDDGRSSLVVVIDAPLEDEISISTGLNDDESENRLPIPPMT